MAHVQSAIKSIAPFTFLTHFPLPSLRPMLILFFFNDTPTPEIYPLPLPDALPICEHLAHSARLPPPPAYRRGKRRARCRASPAHSPAARSGLGAGGGRRARHPSGICVRPRSEEHTSELQSPCNLVCRLLLEKKKEL